MKMVIAACSALFMFSGCASMMRQACSEEGAYAAGMNDAGSGDRMNSGYSYLCKENEKPTASASYRMGYADGVKSVKEQAPQVLIQVGNHPPSSKKWFCEISAFGNHHHAFGGTKLEALKAVQGSLVTAGKAPERTATVLTGAFRLQEAVTGSAATAGAGYAAGVYGNATVQAQVRRIHRRGHFRHDGVSTDATVHHANAIHFFLLAANRTHDFAARGRRADRGRFRGQRGERGTN